LNRSLFLGVVPACAALLCISLVWSGEAQEKPAYVGAGKCAFCHHKEIYASWKETPHGKANPNLEEVKKEIESGKRTEALDPTEDEASYTYRRSVGFDGTSYFEAGVGCEDCHGPGNGHLMAKLADKKAAIVRPAELDPKLGAEICGQCHSRGQTKKPEGQENAPTYIFPKGYLPGLELSDFFEVAPPEEGQQRVQYAEILGSKHLEKGTICFTCHDPHGQTTEPHMLRKPATELCLGCHKVAMGDTKAIVDLATHQPSAAAGATCATCHMVGGSHKFRK
jgi:predicted CXXCH cytochrome family protein